MSSELDEIQAIFFEECAEGLAAAEDGLTRMAAGDVSPDTIARVFRAIHSIKGGAGAFGHAALTAFAHTFENLLDAVRGGAIVPSVEVTRAMLAALDVLSDHVEAAAAQTPPPADAAVAERLQQILTSGGDVPAALDPSAGAAIAVEPAAEVDDFGFTPVAAVVELLDAAPDAALDDAGVAAPFDAEAPAPWAITFAPSRAALANAAEPMLTIREIELIGGRITHVDWSSLPSLRDLDPEDGYLVWIIEAPGGLEEETLRECFDFTPPDSLLRIDRDSAVAAVPHDRAAPRAQAPAEHAPAAPRPSDAAGMLDRGGEPSKPQDGGAHTIRVDLTKLDMLLNLVGELVIRNSILADRLPPKDQQRVELPELARLTREIQDTVMSLRAQPIRQAFSRVPRLLRDLTIETGKRVRVVTTGETTEVDKGVIEKIGDPLTHMIRNAVDHGIESPDERIAAGKPAEGCIRLSAEQKGARILVRVADDGRGIDRQRVRAKAVERGIIAPDAVLSNEEIDQLICAPGFSTAEQISSISGRGVGMDVVRSNVESLGGRVEISSVPGEGATFTMILPLTLAILDGMIARLGGQRFVVPLANVIETVKPEPGQVRALTPTSEVIDLRGEYLPVRRVTDIFGLVANDLLAPEDSLVIIVESESAGRVGLMVDTIDDRREVVIKSLDQNLYPIRGLGGATLLGDGSIALILDIEALVAAIPAASSFSHKGLAA